MNCCSEHKSEIYTIGDYLFGCVNFDIPEEAVSAKCAERGIDPSSAFSAVDQRDRDLLKADLLYWIALGATKVNNTSDSDNGWSHSSGGYTLSNDDKERMLDCANAIYDEYGEEPPFDDSVKVNVHSFGILHCDYDFAGFPLPHIERL